MNRGAARTTPATDGNSPLGQRRRSAAYSPKDVERCAAPCASSTRSRELGAAKLWELLHTERYVHALGALTGNQAMQQVRAGLKAIYLSGWQVAADANLAGQMYPDQSLYPANCVPNVVASASTRRCCAPTRSTTPRASGRVATGSRRSWPTPRRASAARSTRSS